MLVGSNAPVDISILQDQVFDLKWKKGIKKGINIIITFS